MIRTNYFAKTDSRSIVDQKGPFTVMEYTKDLSVSPHTAPGAYFAAAMGVRKKQVICTLNNSGVILQAGAMQVMSGNVTAATDIKGAGDLLKKFVGSRVTGETTIKPKYTGTGLVVLEPTYKYIILEDLANWGGAVVVEDGMFLACQDTVGMKVVARSTISSAIAGGEGLFNTCLQGQGVVCLESTVPYSELFVVDLENDTLKIDGNMAIAWSPQLQFTVERTTKTLIGSAASGEGLVNVYRGTGRVLIAPVAFNPGIATPVTSGV